jgi:hypothetical protein
MIIEARLEDQAGLYPEMEVRHSNGFVIQNLSLGFPVVREVMDRRAAQNGETDYTNYFGARSVVLSVALAPEIASDPTVTEQALEDRLRAWLLPSRRSWLYYRFGTSGEWRRIAIRGSAMSRTISATTNAFGIVPLTWKCASGVIESADEATFELHTSADAELGRTYDRSGDRSYPASPVIGNKTIINNGTAPASPILRIHGPMTQPRVKNMTTGKAIEFISSFALLSGQFLEMNFETGTVYLNADPTNSRYDKLDLTVSEWWELIPGENLLRSYPLTSSAPSVVLGTYRHTYL